ncbi:MAG: indolepyruvate oxidoreductase subunit beta family protein [Pararhodobacter sp.]
MNVQVSGLEAQPRDTRVDAIIKLAVMAVGGQGGGVLSGWIEAAARANGYAVQATSVAGVAQRTGATIYYMEMAKADGGVPVFSLAPAAGDVDILIAAELMEAGRAILRGFVTPDRTTLIASTHRSLAVSEKMAPGDGIANPDEVHRAAEVAAQQLILFDMEEVALRSGSVISSSLFGALAASGALPFPRESFEAAIRSSGRGVEASLRAFGKAFDEALAPTAAKAPVIRPVATAPQGPENLTRDWVALEARVLALPDPVHAMAMAGLRKVVDFQDIAYGGEYLDRLARVLPLDHADKGFELTREAAKYVANAMAYDDLIRVADRKTRPARFARINAEMALREGQILHLTEYTHPRAEEVISLFPARLGRWTEARPRLVRWIDRRVNKGRRLRSDGALPFLQLYLLGGLRGWRRRSLRHAVEVAHLEQWLSTALAHAGRDYALGVETLRLRRLIKGYSDTHARGLSKFDRAMEGAALVAGREDAADWTRRLRDAALQDEDGTALDGAIRTVRSFL